MSSTPKHRRVFISYSHKELPGVDTIVTRLRRQGVLKENDEVLGTTEFGNRHTELRQTVRRQIESASHVVLIWDSETAKSQWVNYEIGLADALGKPIVAVTTGKKNVPVPAMLSNLQVINLKTDG